uniref:Uncharacterized protein n=1 Tax=Lepeophtheirus salmonis TaxID=72036 RepID=A0A0K2V0H7_LEPSM
MMFLRPRRQGVHSLQAQARGHGGS